MGVQRRAGRYQRNDDRANPLWHHIAHRGTAITGRSVPGALRRRAFGGDCIMNHGLAGFRPLLRETLKQDARNIAPWIVLITALSVSSVLAYDWIFTDHATRVSLASTVGANPAFSLIFGPAHNLLTADGFNAWRALALGGFFAALMAILIVVRHSRADEDSGQAELIASSVVGRYTRLMVAVTLAALASVVLGVICSVMTIAFGGGVAASIAL